MATHPNEISARLADNFGGEDQHDVECKEPTAAFLYAGVSSLLSWNAVLTFTHVFDCDMLDGADFGGSGWGFWCAFCYSAALTVGQGLMTSRVIVARLPFGLRWCGGSIGLALSNLALLFCVLWAPGSKAHAFAIALAAVTVMGLSTAVFMPTAFGLAGSISPSLINAAMIGQGVAGALTSALGFIFARNLRTGLYCTFPLAAMFTAVGGLFVYYCCFKKNKIVIQKLEEEEKTAVAVRQSFHSGSVMSFGRHTSRDVECTTAVRSASAIFAQSAWPQAVSVWFVFCVTFIVFPGVLSRWTPSDRITFLVAMYQLMDVAGRAAPNIPGMAITHGPTVSLISALRILFVPAFMFMQRSGLPWTEGSVVQFILVGVFAFSNGYTSTLAMMLGPMQRGIKEDEQEQVGFIMTFFLVFGIFCGSLLALPTQIGVESATGSLCY